MNAQTKEQLGEGAIGLVALAVLHFLTALHPALTGSIAGVIIVGAVVPRPLGAVLAALGWLGVAALSYWFFGQWRGAVLLALYGGVMLVLAVTRGRR